MVGPPALELGFSAPRMTVHAYRRVAALTRPRRNEWSRHRRPTGRAEEPAAPLIAVGKRLVHEHSGLLALRRRLVDEEAEQLFVVEDALPEHRFLAPAGAVRRLEAQLDVEQPVLDRPRLH